jgi:hypothetical protein
MHGLFVCVLIAYPKRPVSAFGQRFSSASDRIWPAAAVDPSMPEVAPFLPLGDGGSGIPDMRLGCRMHPLILFEPAATHYSLTEVPPY